MTQRTVESAIQQMLSDATGVKTSVFEDLFIRKQYTVIVSVPERNRNEVAPSITHFAQQFEGELEEQASDDKGLHLQFVFKGIWQILGFKDCIEILKIMVEANCHLTFEIYPESTDGWVKPALEAYTSNVGL